MNKKFNVKQNEIFFFTKENNYNLTSKKLVENHGGILANIII